MAKTTIHEGIKNQIKEALRDGDTVRLEVLRGLHALFLNELIAKKSNDPSLSDDQVLVLIKRSANQRKDSIEQFEKGGRKDLVKKEKAELKIIEEFLPAMMSREDIKKIVKEKLKKEGSVDPKKMGQFMGGLMKELKGKADGADVKGVVEELVK